MAEGAMLGWALRVWLRSAWTLAWGIPRAAPVRRNAEERCILCTHKINITVEKKKKYKGTTRERKNKGKKDRKKKYNEVTDSGDLGEQQKKRKPRDPGDRGFFISGNVLVSEMRSQAESDQGRDRSEVQAETILGSVISVYPQYWPSR